MDKILVHKWQIAIDKIKILDKYKKWACNKLILSSILAIGTLFVHAQDSTAKRQAVDMATGMRSNGKIYVVVAVLCIILSGLFIYLVNLDKKVGKLEKEINLNGK